MDLILSSTFLHNIVLLEDPRASAIMQHFCYYLVMSKTPKKYTKDVRKELAIRGLNAEELKFTRLLATGITPTTAYRQAFPLESKLSYDYLRRKALALAEKHEIKTEVQTVVETRARLARLAEDRLEQILVTDDSQAKGSKVAEVAMFMYDHANGKATQRIEQTGQFVSVTMNLSGTSEDIPPEILEQLKEKDI